uniref:Uncharacterized protein n=1 Tax=Arundo donax TaxID=35708 RepID=A0A0A9D6M0_ARUDO
MQPNDPEREQSLVNTKVTGSRNLLLIVRIYTQVTCKPPEKVRGFLSIEQKLSAAREQHQTFLH